MVVNAAIRTVDRTCAASAALATWRRRSRHRHRAPRRPIRHV